MKIKLKRNTIGQDKEFKNAVYLIENEADKELLRKNILTVGYDNTFVNPINYQIAENEIEKIELFVSYDFNSSYSNVYIDFNTYFDLIFVKQIENKDIVEDVQAIEKILVDYLNQTINKI